MIRLRKNKYYFAVVLAVIMAVCTFFAVSGLTAYSEVRQAPTNASNKVQVSELYERHGVEYVIGPLADRKDDSGHYTKGYEDINGLPTNNVYGIPSDRFFDADNYLYIEKSVTGEGDNAKTDYILRGWKTGILPVSKTNDRSINEEGYIVEKDTTTTNTGIYYTGSNTSEKYMIIVPDEVTQVGLGNGAFNGTTFTDFGYYHFQSLGATPSDFWVPRERLIGVYFNDSSNLSLFQNSYSGFARNTQIKQDGMPAFELCNNMRFCVLPNNAETSGDTVTKAGLTNIGDYAFRTCQQMVEVNIPSSVTNLGTQAFGGCSALTHISIPSSVTQSGSGVFNGTNNLVDVENNSNRFSQSSFPTLMNYYSSGGQSGLYVIGTKPGDNGTQGFYFCHNNSYTGRLASELGTDDSVRFASYEIGKWYVTGLAGKADTEGKTVYELPATVNGQDDEFRKNIKYDFLNSAGEKVVNDLGTTVISSYDIGRDAVNSTWMMNIKIPHTVDIIGDNAFYFSHVTYLEMYATTLGYKAFFYNSKSSNEYYYIHKNITNYGNNVFSTPSEYEGRWYIFDNYNLYNTMSSAATAGTGVFGAVKEGDSVRHPAKNPVVRYQIPIVANVNSADGDVVIKESDRLTRFAYDADYADGSWKTLNGGGNYRIVYTKRLSGEEFNVVKQADGSWSAAGNNPAATIEGMKSTVWYGNTSYSGQSVTPEGVYNKATTGAVNVYTKKIAKPEIDAKEYDFGGDSVNENAYVTFAEALLSNSSYTDNAENYNVVLTGNKFTYTSGTRATQDPENVHNAGTYELRVNLDPKWGEWEEDYAEDCRGGTVTVNRQLIELGDLNNIPQFTVADGTSLGGTGAGNILYRYAEGWFLYRQNGAEIDSVSVVNSYTRYINGEITLSHAWEKDSDALYTVTYNRGRQAATDSGQYYAYYTLNVKTIGNTSETNYEFRTNTVAANNSEFELRGLLLDNTSISSAVLRKCWYIVMQSNWFVDENTNMEDYDNPFNAPPYALATKNEVSVREWTYEDTVALHMPKLAYDTNVDGTKVTPTISISYTDASGKEVEIKKVSDEKPLSYFINSAMPAGTYTVIISAGAVTVMENKPDGGQEQATYPAITDTIIIEVTPGKLDVDGIITAIANGTETTDEDGFPVYSFPYDGSIHMHGENVNTALEVLNSSINAKFKNAAESNNYWYDKAEYYGEAGITYNLDRWGNSDYVNSAYQSLPTASDKYTVYYCISAKNYLPFGGAEDFERREKKFITVIYNEISVSKNLLMQVEGGNDIYFKDVTYTGGDAHTLVPYSQYYRYEFTENDYVNARNGAYVTLTLNNPQLAKWNLDVTGDNALRFKLADGDDSVLIAYYDITPANNRWDVTPSMSGWSYDGFDSEVHAVSAKLAFTATQSYFRIGTEQTGGDWISLGEYGEEFNGENNYFTVVNGKVNENVAKILSALKPGDYYLFGYAAAYTENEYGLSNVSAMTASENGVRISVGKAFNRWTTSPDIIRWYWSEFSAETNVISAEPLYLISGQLVKFTVLNADMTVIDGLIGFTVDENGRVDGKIAAELKKLHANNYYLLATVEETDYYLGLNELPVDFSSIAGGTDLSEVNGLNPTRFVISQFNNFWVTSPRMTGWQYNAFNVGTNFVSGSPKFIKDGTSVTYYVYKGGDEPEAGKELTENDREFTSVSDVISYLNGNSVGTYWFVAVAEGTDDFTGVRVSVSFEITTNQTNSWKTIPSITGWVYGDQTNHATAGEATFGTVKYYVYKSGSDTPTIDGISFDNLNTELIDLDAGNYRLTVISADTEATPNFVEATRTLDFVIEKAENSWAEGGTPSITGWTWSQEPNKPTNAETAYEFDPANISGEYWTASSDGTLISLVEEEGGTRGAVPTLAGLYAYVTTASETTNYKELKATSYFEIKQYENNWETRPEATLFWTWGEEVNASSALVNAVAEKGEVQFTIQGNKANGDAVSLTSDYVKENGGIKSVLQTLGAGTYSVAASVTGNAQTYSGVDATTSITVNKANLKWRTAPEDLTWIWGAANKPFSAPTAFGTVLSGDTEISVSYRVDFAPATTLISGENNLAPETAEALEKLIKDGHAGVYTLTVTASDNNYNDLTGTAVITVEQADNDWTANEPTNRENYYNKFIEGQFVAPTASLGEAGLKYLLVGENNTLSEITFDAEVKNICDWINRRDAGTYTIRVEIPAANDYKVLAKDITVKVLPDVRNWSNSGYTGTLERSFTEKFEIIVPKMDPVPDDGGSVTYTMTYTEIGKDAPVDVELTGNINDWFNSSVRDAGVYKLTARYDSNNINIQSLEHTATITISKKNISFINNTNPPDWVSYTYEGVTLTVPDAGSDNTGKKHVISYSVSGPGVSSTPELGEGEGKYSTITAYLNSLDVGTYTLTTRVDSTVNYNGLSVESRIIITKASNGYKYGTTPPARLNLIRGNSLEDFTAPEPQRGDMTFTIVGTNYRGVAVSSLIPTLEGLAAGSYTVEFNVPEHENGNYDGFYGQMEFVMSKQSNNWITSPDSTYSLNWSSNGIAWSENFTAGVRSPVASNEKNNTVLFEIISLTAGVAAPQISSVEDFESWLKNSSVNENLKLNAGTYSVRFYVNETDDQDGLSGNSTITINKIDNSLSASESEINWKYDGTEEENVLPEFTATYGIDGIIYSVNGGDIGNNTLRSALNRLSVGRYTLRAEIKESTNYRSVFADVTVTVIQNENGWDDPENKYKFEIFENAEIKTESGATVKVAGWQWGNNSSITVWNAPKPLQGGVVNITVIKKAAAMAADEVVIAFELRYTDRGDGTYTDNSADLEALLRALNAGKYTITAEIPANDNWSVPADGTKSIEFEVLPNENQFTRLPSIAGGGWTYGSPRSAMSEPSVKYGDYNDVRYTYYLVTVEGGSKVRTQVTEFDRAGDYEYDAYLAASPDGNYPELTYTGRFTIFKANISWSTPYNITAWTWNEFSAETNLFSGTANSGGAVTFTVYNGENLVGTFHPDNKGVIRDSDELEILKGLSAGSYSYVVNVDETLNYNSETTDRQTLVIRQAQNRWITYPTVIGWAENLWSSSHMPEAESRYGDVLITITGDKTEDDGTVTANYVWFNALYRNGKIVEGFADYKNELYLAPGGIYRMHGSVAEDSEKYEPLDADTRVEVFLSSSTRPANHWLVLPAISNWTAGEGNGPAIMQGEAFRQSGDLIKTFYYEVDDEKGALVPASELNAEGYPTVPGNYVMHLKAVFEDVAYDTLETEVSFEIYKRVIEWTMSPNISGWSLGSAASEPVAAINFGDEIDSTLTYAYKLSGETDDKAVSDLPTKPGNYVMIVTATAKYCDPAVAYVDFKVSLSANQWVDLPVIEGWSEEFEPNDPTGKALIGEVKYTYATADGVFLGEEKPTTEGSYIMYATVEVEGYETLTTPEGYAFTITPAYDVTLLTVDIVLSSVLCALTVVVIVFAIRRYKENG